MPLTAVVAATACRLVSAAAAVSPVAVAVAAWLSTSVVPLVIELTVVPRGMLGPATAMPTVRLAVLFTVMLVLLAVVETPVRATVEPA